jgi:hypothetical protein
VEHGQYALIADDERDHREHKGACVLGVVLKLAAIVKLARPHIEFFDCGPQPKGAFLSRYWRGLRFARTSTAASRWEIAANIARAVVLVGRAKSSSVLWPALAVFGAYLVW